MRDASTRAGGGGGMRAYLVGGAVRDRLLGLPADGRDFVAVCATPGAVGAAGLRPVGGGFAVVPLSHHGGGNALVGTQRQAGGG